MNDPYVYVGQVKVGSKKTNFMASFYGWGSTASRLVLLRGSKLLFTTKFPDISGTHFIDLRRIERLSRPWSHPVVLSTGPPDWKSSALTTWPLLHMKIAKKAVLIPATSLPTQSSLKKKFLRVIVF